MGSNRHFETARLALIRAFAAALALGLAGGLAVFVLPAGNRLLYLIWWLLLSPMLLIVTVAERKLGPLRVHQTLGLVLLLLVLSACYLLEPIYLSGVMDGKDAGAIAANLRLQVEVVWTGVPARMLALCASIALPLTGLCLARRRRLSLPWQIAIPLLLLLLTSFLGSAYYALETAYKVRNMPAALVESYGLGFDLQEFLHGWLVRDLKITTPPAVACLGYVAGAWWTDRSEEQRCLAERSVLSGGSAEAS